MKIQRISWLRRSLAGVRIHYHYVPFFCFLFFLFSTLRVGGGRADSSQTGRRAGAPAGSVTIAAGGLSDETEVISARCLPVLVARAAKLASAIAGTGLTAAAAALSRERVAAEAVLIAAEEPAAAVKVTSVIKIY